MPDREPPLLFPGPALKAAPLSPDVQSIIDVAREQTLFDADWTPCTPLWREEHPDECDTALRTTIQANPARHWHPRTTRRQILRDAGKTPCEVPACGSGLGPKPYPEDGWVFVQINGHTAMEPGAWYHCTACAITALEKTRVE